MITSVLTIVAFVIAMLLPVIIPAITTAYGALVDWRRNAAPSSMVIGQRRVALSAS